MTEKKNLFDLFGKLVEDVIVTSSKQIFEPIKQLIEAPQRPSLLPLTQTAIFWDYENFPFPKDIDLELFLEALIPSGLAHRTITKRIYGNPINIPLEVLKFLKSHDFEHIFGLETNKPGVTDHTMDIDCATFCQNQSPPLEVILIAGDVDYLQLIHRISKQGHEVTVICRDKKHLSKILQTVVPTVKDRKDILNRCNDLSNLLVSLSQMLNYMLSVHPRHRLSLGEFQKEAEQKIFQEQLKTLVGHLKFLLKSKNFNWQYEVTGEFISPISIPRTNNKDTDFQEKVVLMNLGSEADIQKWNENWDEFQRLYKNMKDQREVIHELYQNCSFPLIRSRFQQKLLLILEKEQIELQKNQLQLTTDKYQNENEKMKKIMKKDSVENYVTQTIMNYFVDTHSTSISFGRLGNLLADKNPGWKKEYQVKQLKNVLDNLTGQFLITGKSDNIMIKKR